MPRSAVETLERMERFMSLLRPEERVEIDQGLHAETPIWVPLPGPQTDAYFSEADILFFGGSAGGGKSELLLGLALNEHTNSIIYRRQTTQLVALQTRLLDQILKSRKGWNGQDDILRLPGRTLEFGSCNNVGDEQKYQGRPHSLKAFDEITHFTEAQFRFLITWMRTTDINERQRVVCAGNPPMDEEGRWVIKYWAPWLDPKHPNPALPGELRWFTTIDGRDTECPDGSPLEVAGEMVKPKSRTFIPSRVTDNIYLKRTGYASILQALPEPLRSQLLLGDFRAGIQDSAWQLFPTAWVEAAMERWTPDGRIGKTMDSIGVDVARGGSDYTVVAARYGTWYAPIEKIEGSKTPTGAAAAGFVVAHLRDRAVVHVDALGIGGETVGHLQSAGLQVDAVVGYDTKTVEGQHDKASHKLKFRNRRAMIHWRFREALDPITGDNVALPPDPELKSDLCSILWKLTPGGILCEDKAEVKKRIGRSPDKGDAVIYAWIATPKTGSFVGLKNITQAEEWNLFMEELTYD